MSGRIVINFRNGTKKEWPDPASRVIYTREHSINYKDGVAYVSIYDGPTETFPLDTIENVYEEPRARF